MIVDSIDKNFVDELFDPTKPGLKIVPAKISPEKLAEMISFIEANAEGFEIKREKYIANNQKVYLLYRGPYDTGSLDETIFSEIVSSYKNLRQKVSEHSEVPFSQGSSIEIKLIHYPVSELGVGIHKDLSSNVNLIVFFNLVGSTNVMTYQDKAGNGPLPHPVRSGDVSIMRGPRTVGEPDIRPYHAVGKIFEPRTVLVIREIDEELEKITNAGNWRKF